MTETTLCFIDCETTGLDPDRHEIWEVALIKRFGEGPRIGEEDSYVWQLPVDLARADPIALNIGHFHDRRLPTVPTDHSREQAASAAIVGQRHSRHVMLSDDLVTWANNFVELTRGCHLVGAVVSFDAERLWKLLRKHGQCPMWHYHVIDVEALAVGWLAAGHDWTEGPPGPNNKGTPPWDSDELSAALGVTVAEEDRHTALGDARWAAALYDAVMGKEPGGDPAPVPNA